MPERHKHLADAETPAGHLAPAALKNVLGYQLAQAAVVCGKVFMREVGGPREPRPVADTMLQLIAENPGCSSVRLAKALAVTKPNITMWVERLVARELVQRTPSASDKRSQELRAAGAALAARATKTLEAGEATTLSHLSPSERSILAELLQKLPRSAARWRGRGWRRRTRPAPTPSQLSRAQLDATSSPPLLYRARRGGAAGGFVWQTLARRLCRTPTRERTRGLARAGVPTVAVATGTTAGATDGGQVTEQACAAAVLVPSFTASSDAQRQAGELR